MARKSNGKGLWFYYLDKASFLWKIYIFGVQDTHPDYTAVF